MRKYFNLKKRLFKTGICRKVQTKLFYCGIYWLQLNILSTDNNKALNT